MYVCLLFVIGLFCISLKTIKCVVFQIEICNVRDVTSVTDFDCIYLLEITVNQSFLFIKLYQMD